MRYVNDLTENEKAALAHQLEWCNAAGMWGPVPCKLHDGGPELLHGSSRCISLTFTSPPTGAYCDKSLALATGAGLSSATLTP